MFTNAVRSTANPRSKRTGRACQMEHRSIDVDRCAPAWWTHYFGSSPGAASFFSRSCPCCPTSRWYEPGSPAGLSISSPTPGQQQSLWQGTARAGAACRSLAAFGCMPPSWNTSSTSLRVGTQRSGILRRQHLERYAAVLSLPCFVVERPCGPVKGFSPRVVIDRRSTAVIRGPDVSLTLGV